MLRRCYGTLDAPQLPLDSKRVKKQTTNDPRHKRMQHRASFCVPRGTRTAQQIMSVRRATLYALVAPWLCEPAECRLRSSMLALVPPTEDVIGRCARSAIRGTPSPPRSRTRVLIHIGKHHKESHPVKDGFLWCPPRDSNPRPTD